MMRTSTVSRLVLVCSLALAGCNDHTTHVVADASCLCLAPDAEPGPQFCNILTGTGCNAGQKCTWIRVSTGSDPAAQLGQIGCAADGTVALDGACMYGASGAITGFDSCKAGLICRASPATEMASGSCQPICSLLDSTVPCSSGFECVARPKFFSNDSADPPVAGICAASCDPVTQIREFDMAPACGSVNPAAPDQGCYGFPSDTASPTSFTCDDADLHPCAPGRVPLLRESSGSMEIVCIAFCDPLPTNNTMPLNKGGRSPHSCVDAGATAGEQCQYFWFWLGSTTPLNQWSNTVGFCVDFTRYTWDHDNMPATPAVPWTACETAVPYADPMNMQPNEDLFWGCAPYP